VESLLGSARPADHGPAPELVPRIESARGLAAVGPIARAGATVAAVMFGAADYASDIGVQPDALALQVARCGIIAGCAEAGIPAIDAPCFAVHDPKVLEAELTFAARNGFRAKAAIHPAHIGAINAAFTPTPERVAWARRVIEASQKGVGTVDGRMVDAAVAREAWRIVGTV
jgi:(S)-citramalyl-CoA lyase